MVGTRLRVVLGVSVQGDVVVGEGDGTAVAVVVESSGESHRLERDGAGGLRRAVAAHVDLLIRVGLEVITRPLTAKGRLQVGTAGHLVEHVHPVGRGEANVLAGVVVAQQGHEAMHGGVLLSAHDVDRVALEDEDHVALLCHRADGEQGRADVLDSEGGAVVGAVVDIETLLVSEHRALSRGRLDLQIRLLRLLQLDLARAQQVVAGAGVELRPPDVRGGLRPRHGHLADGGGAALRLLPFLLGEERAGSALLRVHLELEARRIAVLRDHLGEVLGGGGVDEDRGRLGLARLLLLLTALALLLLFLAAFLALALGSAAAPLGLVPLVSAAAFAATLLPSELRAVALEVALLAAVVAGASLLLAVAVGGFVVAAALGADRRLRAVAREVAVLAAVVALHRAHVARGLATVAAASCLGTALGAL